MGNGKKSMEVRITDKFFGIGSYWAYRQIFQVREPKFNFKQTKIVSSWKNNKKLGHLPGFWRTNLQFYANWLKLDIDLFRYWQETPDCYEHESIV